MPKLILMHGYIGVGKTTYARTLAETSGAVLFVADDWMVHFYGQNPDVANFGRFYQNVQSMIWMMAQDFIKRGHNVILDCGFWKRAERDEYRARAKALDAVAQIYQVTCDDQLAKARALARTYDESNSNMFIDENAYEILKKDFEALDDDEDRIVVHQSA